MDIRNSRPIVLLAFVFAAGFARAQATQPDRLILHIADLTTAESDALTKEFEQRGNAHVAFACLPTGMLVLEPAEAGQSPAALRLHTMPALLKTIAPNRISVTHFSEQKAQELCALAQN
jgi:hypothetical protein